MNSPARLIIVLAAFIFATCVWFPGAIAQSPDPAAPSKIRLVIGDFKKLAGDRRFDFLKQGIPAALQVNLLAYDSLEVVSQEELLAKLDRMELPTRERTVQRALQPDVLRQVGAAYLLRGTFIELQGKLLVSGVLVDVTNNGETKIGLVPMDSKNLGAGIGTFAASTVTALKEAGGSAYARLFAVSCFDDRTSPPSPLSKFAKRDLAMFLTQQLTARRGARAVEWDKASESCENPPPNDTQASRLKVDAVVGGSINVQKDTVYVYPTLFIAENSLSLDMPTVEGRVDNYLQLKEDLGRKVKEVLDGSLTNAGAWKVSELVRTTKPEDYLQRGRELFEQGDLTLAALFLGRALATPSQSDAHYYLGLIRLRQKRFEEASKHLEQFVKQRPDFGTAQRDLGEAYAGLGKYADAITAYERALETDSSLRGVYIDIGNSYFFEGNYKFARQYYQKAAAQEPGKALPQYNLGVVAEQLRDSEEAIKSYKKALEIDPRYESAQRALATLYHDKGSNALDLEKYKQAVEDFTEEIKYGSGARGYFSRAFASSYMVALEPMRDYSRVINDYLEGLKLNSDMRSSAMLNLTEVYILSKRYRDAHDLAESSLKDLREQTRERQIARYLLVVSGILLSAEYAEELILLRRDLANQKGQHYGWDFGPFEKFIGTNASIGEEKRTLILGITEEVKKAVNAKDSVVN